MKQIICNYQRNNKRDRGLSFVTFILSMMFLVFVNDGQAQSYKQNTGYLLQKVEPLTHYFFIPFKHGLVLPYFYVLSPVFLYSTAELSGMSSREDATNSIKNPHREIILLLQADTEIS